MYTLDMPRFEINELAKDSWTQEVIMIVAVYQKNNRYSYDVSYGEYSSMDRLNEHEIEKFYKIDVNRIIDILEVL